MCLVPERPGRSERMFHRAPKVPPVIFAGNHEWAFGLTWFFYEDAAGIGEDMNSVLGGACRGVKSRLNIFLITIPAEPLVCWNCPLRDIFHNPCGLSYGKDGKGEDLSHVKSCPAAERDRMARTPPQPFQTPPPGAAPATQRPSFPKACLSLISNSKTVSLICPAAYGGGRTADNKVVR